MKTALELRKETKMTEKNYLGTLPRTTANLRNAGYDAAKDCDWKQAAEFYQAAADQYGSIVGELAKADHQKLLAFAAQYRRAAQFALLPEEKPFRKQEKPTYGDRHNVLCQCGWGLLGVSQEQIPQNCPQCRFDFSRFARGE